MAVENLLDLQTLLGSSAALLIAAFLLDLALGDPRWLPHPVVLMGKAICAAERRLRSGQPTRDFCAGAALSLLVISLSAAAAATLVALFQLFPGWLSFVLTAALASSTLATRGLLDAVRRVEAPLRTGNLLEARQQLAHIVGRETSALNEDEVMRAALESLAESTSDGIVAPLFYLSLGGVPLAMAYKAVSTLDSMIGYRTERYLCFGKFAARLDDAMNLLPARLTAMFMILATLPLRLPSARALAITWRDHAEHLSPNAGYPEAALAGAFGIRLGGPSRYFGRVVDKAHLGDDLTPVKIEMLKKGRALCLVAVVFSLAIFALLSLLRA
jgi:adenosylcobinamide-phosphate synthase